MEEGEQRLREERSRRRGRGTRARTPPPAPRARTPSPPAYFPFEEQREMLTGNPEVVFKALTQYFTAQDVSSIREVSKYWHDLIQSQATVREIRGSFQRLSDAKQVTEEKPRPRGEIEIITTIIPSDENVYVDAQGNQSPEVNGWVLQFSNSPEGTLTGENKNMIENTFNGVKLHKGSIRKATDAEKANKGIGENEDAFYLDISTVMATEQEHHNTGWIRSDIDGNYNYKGITVITVPSGPALVGMTYGLNGKVIMRRPGDPFYPTVPAEERKKTLEGPSPSFAEVSRRRDLPTTTTTTTTTPSGRRSISPTGRRTSSGTPPGTTRRSPSGTTRRSISPTGRRTSSGTTRRSPSPFRRTPSPNGGSTLTGNM